MMKLETDFRWHKSNIFQKIIINFKIKKFKEGQTEIKQQNLRNFAKNSYGPVGPGAYSSQ